MLDFVICDMTVEDVPAVVAIQAEQLGHDARDTTSSYLWTFEERNKKYLGVCWWLRVVVVDDQIVGFCEYTYNDVYHHVFLSNIAFIPEFQGLGFGSQLMQEILALVEAKLAKRLFLRVEVDNILAQRFYEKHGLREEERGRRIIMGRRFERQA